MKQKIIPFVLIIVILLSSQLTQVFARNEDSATYKFALLVDGSSYIKQEDEMFAIHGCKSYGNIQNTGYLGNDTVYTQGPCTIESLCGELTIYKVDDLATIYESIDHDTYRVKSKEYIFLDNMSTNNNATCFLENGTYIMDMYSGGMSTACRLVVGTGISGSNEIIETDIAAQQLFDFWYSNYHSIKPFGESKEPYYAFIADIDNDINPELLVFFSYLGPGGPTFSVYENSNGNIYHDGDILTSSGTGIHHNLNLIMENNGNLKISDHYLNAIFSDLNFQSISLMSYDSGNCLTEKYASVSYFDEISYSIDVNEEVRTSCSLEEANIFFDNILEQINHNVVFSSEWDVQKTNGFFEIWNKQKKIRNQIKVLLDGTEVVFDQPPVVIDGRTLVPLRAIFEELGATVEWDGNTQTVTSTKGQTTISMSVGKTEMYKNGNLITLDVVPQLVGGRTLVPVRAIAEAFDCEVEWNGDTQTVVITTVNKDAVIKTAKSLYEANEAMGGVTNLATYAEVDALLYNTLNELDVASEYKGITLDIVSTSTAIAVSGALASKGDFSAVGSIGEEFASILNSSEVADVIDGSAKDVLKGEILKRIDTTVPDINAFVLDLGRTAYDRNSKMILDLIMLHGKFKNNNYTYQDAVAYIVIYDTLILNRKTMSMAVRVLSDELPDNFLESLAMSTESAVMSALKTILGSKISGRGINIGAELFTDIVTAYADYVCGMGEDFVKYMKQINHPAINEWVNEVEMYNSNLAQKLNIY